MKKLSVFLILLCLVFSLAAPVWAIGSPVVDLADLRLENRKDRPFTRQELALLFAAMLTEP